MWPPFDPDALGPGYVCVKLADYLTDRINDGGLPPCAMLPCAMLPCERTLAAEHGVSAGSARRAARLLRERNLIVTLPSRGSYVTSGAREACGASQSRQDSWVQ